MSFFDDASLAFLPSGAAGKDGKAYSIKPTDGTGDFTFSRGSNLAATRVGADGLIEKGRENLLLQSNQFDSVSWSGLSKTSGILGYDGTNDAWEITKPAQPYTPISQSVSATGVWTFSLYAKANTLDKISIRNQTDGEKADIDLLNGLITYTSSGIVHSDIELISNDWYRLQITFSGSTAQIAIYVAWNNSTAGSVYIQDAQLEIGLAATDVISTGATTGKAGLLEDEPRFDYSGGATCPSLLLEPSRTNLVQSEYYNPTNTEWRSEGNNGVTITTNDTTSPEGLSNASKLQGGGASNDRLQYNFNTSNTKAVYSVFVKGTGDVVRFSIFNSRSGDRINYDVDANGNFTLNQVTGITNHDIEDYGNGWYRIWGEFTTDAALTNYFQIYSDINGSGAIYLYGVQLEDNATYPTSYIPNHSGGSVTRGAEGQVYSGLSSLIGQTEGTLFLDIENAEGGTEIFSLNRSTANSIFLNTNSNVYGLYIWSDGTTYGPNTLISPNDRIKIAIAYQSNNFAVYANGVQIDTNNSLTWTPNITIDSLNFNVGGYTSSKGVARFNQVLIIPERISNADLATLTTI